MLIADERFSCCCDWGTGKIGRQSLDQWFLVGNTGAAVGYDIIDSAGTVILNNQTGFGTPYLCDDQSAIYCFFGLSSGDGTQSFPRWRKYDSSQTQIWSHDDSDTDIRSIQGSGPLSTTLFHYDVGGDYSFYYCGRSDKVADANTVARLVKLDSTGTEVWVATAHETFSGASFSVYGFSSCAVDSSGNVCAVGFRQKYTGVGPAVLVKEDYIVYYFDSDGNEVWHDDIADDVTLNANNKFIVAVQCCFDDAGNVYVGFGYGDTTKSVPIVRKYDASGGITWTKNQSAAQVSVYALLLTADEKMLVQTATGNGSVIRQYSGASHGTTDWTFNLISNSAGGDMTVNRSGDVYAININESGGITTRWRKISGSAGTQTVSGGDMALAFRCFAKPGKHPHFL